MFTLYTHKLVLKFHIFPFNFQAYELSTLTGTQVMLLVASETGHVYTFATRKLQPMITSDAGKALIQTCLNSPDPPPGSTSSGGAGSNDQRMSATGYEETELTYNIADDEQQKVRQMMYNSHYAAASAAAVAASQHHTHNLFTPPTSVTPPGGNNNPPSSQMNYPSVSSPSPNSGVYNSVSMSPPPAGSNPAGHAHPQQPSPPFLPPSHTQR